MTNGVAVFLPVHVNIKNNLSRKTIKIHTNYKMLNQCMGMISSCLYGDADWSSPSPDIPASQPIPDVILDTTTMGQVR